MGFCAFARYFSGVVGVSSRNYRKKVAGLKIARRLHDACTTPARRLRQDLKRMKGRGRCHFTTALRLFSIKSTFFYVFRFINFLALWRSASIVDPTSSCVSGHAVAVVQASYKRSAGVVFFRGLVFWRKDTAIRYTYLNMV